MTHNRNRDIKFHYKKGNLIYYIEFRPYYINLEQKVDDIPMYGLMLEFLNERVDKANVPKEVCESMARTGLFGCNSNFELNDNEKRGLYDIFLSRGYVEKWRSMIPKMLREKNWLFPEDERILENTRQSYSEK